MTNMDYEKIVPHEMRRRLDVTTIRAVFRAIVDEQINVYMLEHAARILALPADRINEDIGSLTDCEYQKLKHLMNVIGYALAEEYPGRDELQIATPSCGMVRNDRKRERRTHRT